MSKLLYTRFTKLIINHFLSCNNNIPRRSDFKMHSEGDDSPLTKLSNTVDGKFKFGMEIPNIMINDAFKKSAGYKYYKAKKVESKKAKATKEPEEQHVSPVRRGLGKGYMRSRDQEANVPSMFKKNVVPRKTRSLTVADNIIKEPIAVELAKSISIQEQRRQQRDIMTQLLIDQQIDRDVEDTYAEQGKKLKVMQHKILHVDEEKDIETNDSNDSDMDLSEDEPRGDDDATRFGVFVYNKSIEPLKSTYLNPIVTTSSLEYIQTLLNDPPANELMDFMSNLVYTDAQTTSSVIYPEGNPE
ncbi:hypothetical protein Tco_0216384 [Tanacetum coccineum]